MVLAALQVAIESELLVELEKTQQRIVLGKIKTHCMHVLKIHSHIHENDKLVIHIMKNARKDKAFENPL